MTDPFVTHRRLLFTVAYEMLGSAADAEDVVQETWLRWADVDHDQVHDPRAYLVQVVTRQALNRLRTLARRREDYVGEWLPEPLLTSPDVADDVVLAESVSMAMLTVLETLEPTERAVFVLREVFGTSYDEIGEAVGKTSAAVRQINHRAREHVEARRPRVQVTPAEQRAAVELDPGGGAREVADSLYGDLFGLTEGGGERRSLFRYFHGRSSLATWLRAVVAQRYVDRVRVSRRLEPLPEEDGIAAPMSSSALPDPDASHYLQLVRLALARAVASLEARDRLRLRCYYAEELTLAETGRLLREHEATVSRHLARTRRTIREQVERQLRDEIGLNATQISRSFELVSADAGSLDLNQMLEGVGPRKEPEPDRSI